MMHQCCGWSMGLQGAQLQVWMLLRAQCCQWLQNPTLLRHTKLSAISQRADAVSRLAPQNLVIQAQKGAGMQMEVSSWRWLEAVWGAQLCTLLCTAVLLLPWVWDGRWL